MTVRIAYVPPEGAVDHASALEGFAARSLGRWTADRLLADVQARLRQMWAAMDGDEVLAVMLTRVEPEGVYIDAAAGRDRARWADAFDATVEAVARETGKRRIFANVRPGWAKDGQRLGWKEVHREFVKEVA